MIVEAIKGQDDSLDDELIEQSNETLETQLHAGFSIKAVEK